MTPGPARILVADAGPAPAGGPTPAGLVHALRAAGVEAELVPAAANGALLAGRRYGQAWIEVDRGAASDRALAELAPLASLRVGLAPRPLGDGTIGDAELAAIVRRLGRCELAAFADDDDRRAYVQGTGRAAITLPAGFAARDAAPEPCRTALDRALPAALAAAGAAGASGLLAEWAAAVEAIEARHAAAHPAAGAHAAACVAALRAAAGAAGARAVPAAATASAAPAPHDPHAAHAALAALAGPAPLPQPPAAPEPLPEPRTSVFVLTVGDPAYPRCMAALGEQPLDRFRTYRIENVAPFNAAFQLAVDRCETEFFIQVDEDMILFHGALERMEAALAAAPLHVGMVCFHLYDDDLGRAIQGIKIFRKAALVGTVSRDRQASEMDLLAQMHERGYAWVLDPTIVGRHGSVYTPETIYRRYKAMYEKDIRAWNTVDPFVVRKAQDFLARRDPKDLFALLGAWHGLVMAPLVQDREAHDTHRYGLRELALLRRMIEAPHAHQPYDPDRKVADEGPGPLHVRELVPARGRVLIVCDHYWPFSGGVESIAADLARVLRDRGYAPEVATAHTPERRVAVHEGVPIHGLDIGGGAEPFVANASYQARGMIESGCYQAAIVIGAPDSWSLLALENLDRRRAAPTRIVVQFLLNGFGVDKLRAVPSLEPRVLQALRAAGTRAVLSPRGLTASFLARHGLDYTVTPNATFALAGDGAAFRRRHRLPDAGPLVLHLASLYPEKNHVEFLDALAADPDLAARVLFVGRPVPHERAHGERFLARLRADPRCTWIPGIDRAEVPDALAAATALVLPSVAEVSPVCLLEAMSVGLPWIATPAAGNAAELEGGVVCPVAEFPAALRRLLDDPAARVALGAAGRAHWQRHHSWDAVGPRWVELIEGTHAGAGAGAGAPGAAAGRACGAG